MDADPVRDLLRVVERQAFDSGLGVGQRRSSNGAFMRGLVVGALLAVAGIGACAAQAVPATRGVDSDLPAQGPGTCPAAILSLPCFVVS